MRYFSFIVFGLLIFGAIESHGQNEMNLSADSLYNLGNLAYGNEQFDDAIFHYEKAKLLDPGANDISTNLQLANERLSTDIIEIEPFFLATWWNSLCGIMLPGGWKIVSVLSLIGLLLLFYLYFFKNKPDKKNMFYGILGALLIFFLVTILAGNTRANQIFNSPYAIVFGGEQSLYLGPDLVSEKVKQITGGNKLKILDEDGEWYKVSAMDSEQGWIKKENVKHLKF